MDLDEFRSILSNSRADVWEIIDAAITLASTDYAGELKHRRDGIVERLYTQQCSNCDVNLIEQPLNGVVRTSTINDDRHDSPLTPQSVPQDDDDDDQPDPFGGLFDDVQTKILSIKEQLEDPHQTDDDVVELLQTLADMDLTFTGLKETDIGRHVNRLQKHQSNEVRSLVKQLVRKWKDLVDEWVYVGAPAPATLTDGDSPLVQNVPRSAQNGHHQVPDFGYSPNPHNGSSGSERNHSEPEQQRANAVVSKKAAPSRPAPQSRPAMVASVSAPPNAYVQQLEASRLKLLHLEHELEQTRAQCALMSGGVNASQHGFHGAANSVTPAGIDAFEIEYEQWVEVQNKKTNALKTALHSALADTELDILIKDTMNHYANLFNIKATAAKADVCYLISGVWKTSTECLFLWIGGFRPSELLKVLVPQLDLLDQQSHDLYNLIQACQQAEDTLTQGMEKLQQTLAKAVACGQALEGGCYEMRNAMDKLEELVRLVIQADYVRHETLQQTLRCLTTKQAAQGLISLGEYFQRLRDLSSAWAMRLCEPAHPIMHIVESFVFV